MDNSAVATFEFQNIDDQIITNSLIIINELKEFPIEDFFKEPFTATTNKTGNT